MRLLAAIAIVVAMSASARAVEGMPGEQVLADMGLGGMQIVSDETASAVRGSGFEPGSFLDGFDQYRRSIDDFHSEVADFQHRIDNHVFTGKAGFDRSKKDFHKHVKKFHRAVKKFRHKHHPRPGHGGMGHSKPGHAGKHRV